MPSATMPNPARLPRPPADLHLRMGSTLALVMALTACQPAAEAPKLNPAIPAVQVNADAMTRLVAQREWLQLQQASTQSKLPAHVQVCIARLQPDQLAPRIAPVLHQRFADSDRAAVNAFLDTPAGQHLSTALLNTLHGDPEAMHLMQQQLSMQELHAQVQFTQTKLGLLLMGGLDPTTRAELQAAIAPVLETCQDAALA